MISKIIKNSIPYAIIGVLLIIMWGKGGAGVKNDTIDVKADSVYTPIKIDSVVTEFDTVDAPKPIYIEKVNPINQDLLKRYKESSNQLAIYKEAIKENTYKQTYEDSIQKVTVHTDIRGKLLKQSITTVRKPIEIPSYTKTVTKTIIKYDRDKVFVGGSIYVPLVIGETVDYGVDVAFKNKKGNIIELGITPKRVVLSYKYNIW